MTTRQQKLLIEAGEQLIGELRVTDTQAAAIDMLSRAIDWKTVAKETGVAVGTIGAWMRKPEFRAAVRDRQWEYLEAQRENFALLIADSMLIEAQALRGEIKATDPRARLAHDILKLTAYRIATTGDFSSRSVLPAPGATHVIPERTGSSDDDTIG